MKRASWSRPFFIGKTEHYQHFMMHRGVYAFWLPSFYVPRTLLPAYQPLAALTGVARATG
nr:hypothetical protein [Hyphomonas sp. 34-62-18]